MPDQDSATTIRPRGLKLTEEFIGAAQEARLIDHAERAALVYTPYDPGNRRASTSYGWKYDFENDTFLPCSPIPDALLDVRDAAAEFAGIAPGSIAECLLNRYDPGAMIQPHFDKPVWDKVIGLSLGSVATMLFEKVDGSVGIPVVLPPRSIYLLDGDARYVFQHSLPPHPATRWSITFRCWSNAGIALRDRSFSAR